MAPDSSGSADLGDVFSVTVTVDLPQVTAATDITMEIFAIDPTSGLGTIQILRNQDRAEATGQPSQPMGWPGFFSETVLPYLFTRIWETTLQFFAIPINFSSKAPRS